MLIMTMKKCVHVHLRGVPAPSKMTNDFLIQMVFCQKKNGGLIYWCWSKTGDEVGEFTLNAVKMVVCLNSVVSFDMYSQQFTLCYCPAKAFFLVFTFKICLRHQSVTPFLSYATSPLKNPWSAPPSVVCLFIHNFEHFSEQSNSVISTVVRYPSCFWMFTLISIPPICPLPKSWIWCFSV